MIGSPGMLPGAEILMIYRALAADSEAYKRASETRFPAGERYTVGEVCFSPHSHKERAERRVNI